MMTEAEIKAEARLLALEYLVIDLMRKNFLLSGATVEQLRAAQKRFLETLRMQTFGGDPGWSDLVAAEFEDAVRALLEQVVEPPAAD